MNNNENEIEIEVSKEAFDFEMPNGIPVVDEEKEYEYSGIEDVVLRNIGMDDKNSEGNPCINGFNYTLTWIRKKSVAILSGFEQECSIKIPIKHINDLYTVVKYIRELSNIDQSLYVFKELFREKIEAISKITENNTEN